MRELEDIVFKQVVEYSIQYKENINNKDYCKYLDDYLSYYVKSILSPDKVDMYIDLYNKLKVENV